MGTAAAVSVRVGVSVGVASDWAQATTTSKIKLPNRDNQRKTARMALIILRLASCGNLTPRTPRGAEVSLASAGSPRPFWRPWEPKWLERALPVRARWLVG